MLRLHLPQTWVSLEDGCTSTVALCEGLSKASLAAQTFGPGDAGWDE